MLDHMKDALGIFVEHVVSPAVARTGELDEVVKNLKQGLVKYVVERHGAPKDVIARHLGKSDRWLYRQLEDFEAARKEPSAEPHEGYRLMCDALGYFSSQAPRAATATECARHLRQLKWKISTQELEPALTLYAGMGYLQPVEGHSGEEIQFRAVSNTYTVKASGERERMQLLSRHMGAILPIAISYLRGDEAGRFSMSEGEVLEKHLIAAVRDIWQYQVTRLNQAVEDSVKEDPDETGRKVRYRTMFLCGLGPFFDDPRGGNS